MSKELYPFPIHMLAMDAMIPAVTPGEDFWAAARLELVGQDLDFLAEEVPADLRVWLLTHGQGQQEAGAKGGLALARALAARGRSTVLVDAQEGENSLTRACGRLFRSGWLDMARYGTSLTSAALAVDWVGRQGYFLGLGSYCPVEITAPEIQTLLSRFQGHVDEVIVVCGPGPEAAPWTQVAGEYLYCWDAASEAVASRDKALTGLESWGIPCAGVLGMGVEPEPQVVIDTSADKAETVVPLDDGPDAVEAVSPPESHSSGIFRWVALTGFLVVAVLAVFIWKFTGNQVGPGELASGGQEISPEVPAVTGVDLPVVLPAALDSCSSLVVVADSSATALDSLPSVSRPALKPVMSPEAVADSLPETAVEKPSPEAAWEAVAGAFAGPVGERGWALHVYSLRDSLAARREIHLVARRGIQAVMAPVVLRDSTRWFRVYVGDFPSRDDALAAEPALKWKLRTDWARPTVLPRSARD